jgi:hypothetical protein
MSRRVRDLLSAPGRNPFWMILSLACVVVLFAGCGATGPSQADLSGHWKGQLVAVDVSGQGANPGTGKGKGHAGS